MDVAIAIRRRGGGLWDTRNPKYPGDKATLPPQRIEATHVRDSIATTALAVSARHTK